MMTKDEFFARVESELALDEGKSYDDLFEAVLTGIAIADLESAASKADEDMALTHHGDESLGYWEGSLGLTSATGPRLLGISDLLLESYSRSDSDDIVGPCGGWS